MEFTLKIVLTADKDLLTAIQNLAGVTVTGSAAPDAPVISMNGEQKEKRTRKKSDDTSAAQEKTPVEKTDTATEEKGSAPGEVKTEHTIESLREIAVPKSRGGKKDEIKKWLSEAGYPDGLATLQPKDFDAFHTFITQL